MEKIGVLWGDPGVSAIILGEDLLPAKVTASPRVPLRVPCPPHGAKKRISQGACWGFSDPPAKVVWRLGLMGVSWFYFCFVFSYYYHFCHYHLCDQVITMMTTVIIVITFVIIYLHDIFSACVFIIIILSLFSLYPLSSIYNYLWSCITLFHPLFTSTFL